MYPPEVVLVPPLGRALTVNVAAFNDTVPSELTTSIFITVPTELL